MVLSAWREVPGELKVIYVSAALDCIGWSVTAPVLPTLYHKIGVSSSQVSQLAALTGIISFLSASVQGSLSDKYRKIDLLQVSTLASIFSQVMYGLFALDILRSWPVFVTVRAISSFFKMGMIVSQAFVVDYCIPL